MEINKWVLKHLCTLCFQQTDVVAIVVKLNHTVI